MEMLMSKIPGLRRKDNMEKRKQEEFMKGEFHEQTKKLIDNMIKALHADHNSIKHKTGPALARIKMLRQIDDLLRKKAVQVEFLDLQGLEVLSKWIDQNPDQSYPLPQVVEMVFDILERLPI
jgi:hypothetical protein